MLNGWQYAVSITAFDRGNEENNLESLESSPVSNNYRAFAGKPINESITKNHPFVYPNPYYAGASWEGRSSFQEQSRKLYFANLPKHCEINVFTLAGDFLDQIIHRLISGRVGNNLMKFSISRFDISTCFHIH